MRDGVLAGAALLFLVAPPVTLLAALRYTHVPPTKTFYGPSPRVLDSLNFMFTPALSVVQPRAPIPHPPPRGLNNSTTSADPPATESAATEPPAKSPEPSPQTPETPAKSPDPSHQGLDPSATSLNPSTPSATNPEPAPQTPHLPAKSLDTSARSLNTSTSGLNPSTRTPPTAPQDPIP